MSEQNELKPIDLRMDAYYYSFDATGVPGIDRILSAVACAGKSFHGTDFWNENASPWEGHTGNTPAEWIQNAANDAAKECRFADERKTDEQIRDAALEEAAAECEREMMFPGARQESFAHHGVQAAAKAIRALMGKEGKS